jgi:hypothetical protein
MGAREGLARKGAHTFLPDKTKLPRQSACVPIVYRSLQGVWISKFLENRILHSHNRHIVGRLPTNIISSGKTILIEIPPGVG